MLPKPNRLNLADHFLRLKKYGRALKIPYFTLLWLPRRDNQNTTRVGFVVSNRLGKATTRNYLRRRLRETVKINLAQIPPGLDLALIANPKTHDASLEELSLNFADLLTHLKP